MTSQPPQSSERGMEKWEQRFDILASKVGLDGNQMDELRHFCRTTLHQELQKARADWLRSEIEKWEKYLDGLYKHRGNIPMPTEVTTDIYRIGFNEGWNSGVDVVINQDLTSIITRYKEELKVLEN